MIALLCEELERLGEGIDLGELAGWLSDRFPEAEVRTAAGPCGAPEDLLDPAHKGAGGIVLGLCGWDGERQELHARARKLGIDPTRIEVVNLGGYCARLHPRPAATAKAKLLLEAALKKLKKAAPGRQANAKPFVPWEHKLSRRSLFTLPPVRYEVVPSIRREACASEEGCRECAKVCPHDALRAGEDGRMALAKQPCTGCGACVTACPLGAFDFPGSSPAQIEAQSAALLNGASTLPRPRGILFLCHKGISVLNGLAREGRSIPEGWLPLEVPCVGMVTPGWILGCLSRGAASVAVLPCRREDCRFGQEAEFAGRVDYCRDLIGGLGGASDTVKLLDPEDPEGVSRALADLPSAVEEAEAAGTAGAASAADGADAADGSGFGPEETAKTILALARKFGASPEGFLAHPASPLGVIEIGEGCTACNACAAACPTAAIVMDEDEEGVSLSFDARVCVGCGECAPVCPEKVMRVERGVALDRLRRGRETLHRVASPRCEKCGGPIAPQAMLDKIGKILGEDNPAMNILTKRCAVCRQMY